MDKIILHLKNAASIGWTDTKIRYRRSVLGPIWLTLSNAVGTIGLCLVWSKIFHLEFNDLIPALSMGMTAWIFISGCVTDSPLLFVRYSSLMKAIAIPQWFFVIRVLIKHIINLIHNFAFSMLVVLFMGLGNRVQYFEVLASIFVLVLNMFWMMHVLALVGARYRDVEFIVASAMPLVFFLTPILFVKNNFMESVSIVKYNPFAYFIEALRQGVLGESGAIENLAISVAILAVGVSLLSLLIRRSRRKLIYWI